MRLLWAYSEVFCKCALVECQTVSNASFSVQILTGLPFLLMLAGSGGVSWVTSCEVSKLLLDV
jgi:hypothetical protein